MNDRPTADTADHSATRPRRRRASVAAIVVVLLILIGLGAYQYLRERPRSIHLVVDGADYVEPGTIREALGLTTTEPLSQLDPVILAERVRSLPGVTEATVSFELPDTVIVHIVERKPILVLQCKLRAFVVAENGMVLEELLGPDRPDLPVVVDPPGVNLVKVGQIIDLALLRLTN